MSNEKHTEDSAKSLWSIRKKEFIEFPTPSCGCKCYDCRKAHHLFREEKELNKEFKRLLENEKAAMSSTIIEVEELEKSHKLELENVNIILDQDKAFIAKISSQLDSERRLRLTEGYQLQQALKENATIINENKVLSLSNTELQKQLAGEEIKSLYLQEDIEKTKLLNIKLTDRLKKYEQDILELENLNNELKIRFSKTKQGI